MLSSPQSALLRRAYQALTSAALALSSITILGEGSHLEILSIVLLIWHQSKRCVRRHSGGAVVIGCAKRPVKQRVCQVHCSDRAVPLLPCYREWMRRPIYSCAFDLHVRWKPSPAGQTGLPIWASGLNGHFFQGKCFGASSVERMLRSKHPNALSRESREWAGFYWI